MVSMARVFDVRISNSYQHDESFRCPDMEVISMTRVFDVRISNSGQNGESFRCPDIEHWSA